MRLISFFIVSSVPDLFFVDIKGLIVAQKSVFLGPPSHLSWKYDRIEVRLMSVTLFLFHSVGLPVFLCFVLKEFVVQSGFMINLFAQGCIHEGRLFRSNFFIFDRRMIIKNCDEEVFLCPQDVTWIIEDLSNTEGN